MLDYENEMFLDILNADGLVIAAKGLGLEDVFLSLLKVHCDPGSLVLVLGTTPHEEAYYVDRLTADNVSPLPRIISSESASCNDRIALYLQGGVMFIPARILIVDLLKDRLPTPHITGILVQRAHSVLGSCQEAFAVRLYRQKNKTGFVKAFSSSPQAFSAGFSQVSRVMKTLFLKQLLLWPRFQATVHASLSACTPTVTEMHVQLTPDMKVIQNAVLELMSMTVKEIKRINPTLDVDTLTVEDAIAKSFHKILQSQLDPIWHQLSSKTKTLVADLKLFRVFLHYLTRYDCITFQTYISTYRNRDYAMNSSGWLLLDAANILYEAANRRVVGGTTASRVQAASAQCKQGKKAATAARKKQKSTSAPRKKKRIGELQVESPVKFTKLSQEELDDDVEEQIDEESMPVEEQTGAEEEKKEEAEENTANNEPEPSPKWLVLKQVLQEIKEESRNSAEQERVLVLVEDKLTAKQLQDYLLHGSRQVLSRLRKRQLHDQASRAVQRSGLAHNARSPSKMFQRHRDREDQHELLLSTQLLASQAADDKEKEEAAGKQEEQEEQEKREEFKDVYILSQTEEKTSSYHVLADKISELDLTVDTDVPASAQCKPPIVIIQTIKCSGNPLSLPQTLDETRPRYIVLYQVDVTAIRRIEVYQTALPEVKVQVYVVLFGGSVEEQAYLTALRREKNAFESLIREKQTMVVPDDQDGKSDTCMALDRDTDKPSDTVNSRRGDTVKRLRQTVIVDMREFNSELPAMIHRRGIDIEPLTLQVGDYILTPEICVERKSISDLIGSLNNGRLYNQAKAMTRYYARPILLIESGQNKPLTLMGNYFISNDMGTSDVQARLVLLTLHFPQLRVFWSPSPSATAQLFEELKQFREEPDSFKAVGIGADLDQELEASERYNPGVYDLVARLPGVTSKNIRSIVTHATSLDHLATFTKESLTSLMGNSREAECLYNAIHLVYNAEDNASNTGKPKMWRGKKFGGAKRR